MQWMNRDGTAVEDRAAEDGFRKGAEVDFSKPFTGGPVDVGFDSFFGISASLDMSPYCWLQGDRVVAIPRVELPANKDSVFMNQVAGMATEDFRLEEVLPRIAAETARLIRESAAGRTPFFCYVPLTSPHLPVVPTPESVGKSGAGAYGDFVVATDQALGEILRALDETGQAEDTLLLFTSDNGGLFHWWDFRADDDGGAAPKTPRGEENRRFGHQSNADWRGTKADIYEGGHRVPFVVRWPAVVQAGRVVDATVELNDLYATIAELVGQAPRGTSGMDSYSLLPLLRGQAAAPRPFAVHHSLLGVFALRHGPWKLVEGRGSGGFSKPRHLPGQSDPPGQLYHLGEDPRETRNRHADEPERAAQLAKLLQEVKDGRSPLRRHVTSNETSASTNLSPAP